MRRAGARAPKCAPAPLSYLLGPGVIFRLYLKLAVLRVAAAGLGGRASALPQPLLFPPLRHGSAGPRSGRRARAGSHAGPGAGNRGGGGACRDVPTAQPGGGGTASMLSACAASPSVALGGLARTREHTPDWRARALSVASGKLRVRRNGVPPPGASGSGRAAPPLAGCRGLRAPDTRL